MLEIALIASCLALVIALFALARTVTPPQTKHVLALTTEVKELTNELLAMAAKVSKGNRQVQAEKAREVREVKRAEETDLITEAQQILATASAPAAPKPQAPAQQLADKAQLRKLAGLTH